MGLLDVIKPRVVEMGKLKIGFRGEERESRSGGKYRVPQKLDHFIVTTLIRDDATGNYRQDDVVMGELAARGFADPKDGKVRELPIALLSNDLEDIMQARYVWYFSGRLAATSDGIKMTKYVDSKKSAKSSDWGWLKEPIELPWEEGYLDATDSNGNKLFKMHTTFNCMLALKQSRFGGVYKFRTTSQITASQLYGSLTTIKQATGGYLRGVPLILAMRPLEVSPEVNGKVVKSKVYVVHVELIGEDLLQIQNMVLERAKIDLQRRQELEKTLLEYRRILNAPGENESATEQTDISEEFHPEEQTSTVPSGATSDAEPSSQTEPVQEDPLLAQLADPKQNTEPVSSGKPAPVTKPNTSTAGPEANVAPQPTVADEGPQPAVDALPVPVVAQTAPETPVAVPAAPQAAQTVQEPRKRGRPPKPKPAVEPWDQAKAQAEIDNDRAEFEGTEPVVPEVASVQPEPIAVQVPAAEVPVPARVPVTDDINPAESPVQPPAPGEEPSEEKIEEFRRYLKEQIDGCMRAIHVKKLAALINESHWVPEEVRDGLLDLCYAKHKSFTASPNAKPVAPEQGMFK